MKQGNRLDKLVELNQGFENLAVAPLIEARTAFQKQEDQLKQLLDYRDEYQRQLEEKLTGSTSASSSGGAAHFQAAGADPRQAGLSAPPCYIMQDTLK